MNLAKQGLSHDAYCVIVVITADIIFFYKQANYLSRVHTKREHRHG